MNGAPISTIGRTTRRKARVAFFLVYPCQYGARWCSRELAKVREPEACPFFEPPFTVQTIFRPEAPMPAYPRTKTESRWRSSALTRVVVQPGGTVTPESEANRPGRAAGK
jgi:hypothetical protein